MTLTPMEKFCHALNLLLTRIKEYCSLHKEKGQPYGLCTANPKRASIGVPTKEIHAELEKRARDHFTRLNAEGFSGLSRRLRAWSLAHHVDLTCPLNHFVASL